MEALEQSHHLSRGSVSLVYSVSLVCLTAAVLFGWRLYHRLSPALLVLLACGMAGSGLIVAAIQAGYMGLLIGYGVLFGVANGLGYGFVLQLSARTQVIRAGSAMALVTACYALGATGFAWLLASWVAGIGLEGALGRQALALAVGGLSAAWLILVSGLRYETTGETHSVRPRLSGIAWFWWVYACNVFAGLMVIGHAAGIVIASGGGTELAATGVVLIGLGNALGGLAAGVWNRHLAPNYSLGAMPVLTALALIPMLLAPVPWSAMTGLALAGFAYGASIAVFPHAILMVYGSHGPRAYGRVFTAWGVAGLAGPWLAGVLYQFSGDYRLSIVVAVLFALLSAAMVSRLPLSTSRP